MTPMDIVRNQLGFKKALCKRGVREGFLKCNEGGSCTDL